MLFRAGLLSLGYKVTSQQARVVRGLEIDAPRPMLHMVLRVDLPEGTLLADVRFGNVAPTTALKLVSARQPSHASRAKAGEPGRTRTCNQTVMSGSKSVGFIDFAVFSFAFDRVCCALLRSFLVQNWCGTHLVVGFNVLQPYSNAGRTARRNRRCAAAAGPIARRGSSAAGCGGVYRSWEWLVASRPSESSYFLLTERPAMASITVATAAVS